MKVCTCSREHCVCEQANTISQLLLTQSRKFSLTLSTTEWKRPTIVGMCVWVSVVGVYDDGLPTMKLAEHRTNQDERTYTCLENVVRQNETTKSIEFARTLAAHVVQVLVFFLFMFKLEKFTLFSLFLSHPLSFAPIPLSMWVYRYFVAYEVLFQFLRCNSVS